MEPDSHQSKHLDALIASVTQIQTSNRQIIPRIVQKAHNVLLAARKSLTIDLIQELFKIHSKYIPAYLAPFISIQAPQGTPKDEGNISSLFLSLIITIYYFDNNDLANAAAASLSTIDYSLLTNDRHIDFLLSRFIFYHFLCAKKQKLLASKEESLMSIYRHVTLQKFANCQSVLINTILSMYLQNSRFETALSFIENIRFPENTTPGQSARFLYYRAHIYAFQLKHHEAFESVQQAIKKYSKNSIFVDNLYKMSIMLQLLLGEVPEKSMAKNVMNRTLIRPYISVVRCVRDGSVSNFNKIFEKYAFLFKKDSTYILMFSLQRRVVNAALKIVCKSYSRISIDDVRKKICCNCREDTEYVVANSIALGNIVAEIDYENGYLISRESGNIYFTTEPQKYFNGKIRYFLSLHDECVRTFRFNAEANENKIESADFADQIEKSYKGYESLDDF